MQGLAYSFDVACAAEPQTSPLCSERLSTLTHFCLHIIGTFAGTPYEPA